MFPDLHLRLMICKLRLRRPSLAICRLRCVSSLFGHCTLVMRLGETLHTRMPPNILFFVGKLFVNCSNLVVQVEALLINMSLASAVRDAIEAVQSNLLSSGLLFLRYWLPGNAVKDIASLTCKTLEVVGHIYR